MVEVPLALLSTAISTIIVVTMATIFFCCWRRKGSEDISIKASQNISIKEELKKERSASPAPADLGRSENGALAENQSPPAFMYSEDDTGDFSAVQRETEILRSYRKPPPPKNRAKQTRVPRQLTSGNEFANIFTELSEEDGKNENGSVSNDDGRALLRHSSEDSERTKRDTRSSMLADIEQTLAALHISEQSADVPSGEGSLSDDKTNIIESVPKVAKDTQDEMTVNEPQIDDLMTHNNKSSPSEMPSSPEVKVEPAIATVATVAESNHAVKPKPGPKISPKPSPRVSARTISSDSNTIASVEADKYIDTQASTTDLATVSTKFPSSETDVESSDMGMPEETASGLQTILKSTDETTTNNIQFETPLDNTGSDVASIPTDTILRDVTRSEGTVDSSNNDRPETAKISDTTKTLESPEAVINIDEDTLTEVSRAIAMNSIYETDFASQVQSESETLVSNGNVTVDSTGDQALHSDIVEAVPSSPGIEDKGETTLDRETVTVPGGDGDDERSHELEKQQKDSTEDLGGKGKISKIPVRAGSKPRSSPPKQPGGEKT